MTSDTDNTTNEMFLAELAAELSAYTYTFANEQELHVQIGDVLSLLGIPAKHEHVAGERDRFDFLLGGGVVIEAKVKGSLSAALRQVLRYCERGDVSGVLLVTTRLWGHASNARTTMTLAGKPVRIVRIGGQSF